MRMTFAGTETTASQVECTPGSIIELMAMLGTVFMRTRFGEHYLRPVSLWKGSLMIGTVLGLIRYFETNSTSDKPVEETWSGLFIAVLAASFLALLGKRFLLAPLILYFGLVPYFMIRERWPWFANPMRSDLESISWTFFAFGIAFMFVAGNHITLSSNHEAPLALSCGRSSSLWMRVPAAFRPWRTEWDVQRYAEPALIATIGILVLGLFSNWFGAFLLLVALCISFSATARFRDATRRVASAASGGRVADAFADEVKGAEAKKPSIDPSREPFFARPKTRR